MTRLDLPLPLWQLSHPRRHLGAVFVSAILFAVGMMLVLAGCQGCGGAVSSPADAAAQAKSQREVVHVVLNSLATAVLEANTACTIKGKADRNLVLLDKCTAAYDPARENLLAAEQVLDLWDTSEQQTVACRAAVGVASARVLQDDLKLAGVAVPSILTDALSAYSTFMAGSCPLPIPDAGADQ